MATLPGHTGDAHQMAESKAFCPQLSASVSQLPSLWTSLCVSKAGTQGHILTKRASFSELSM